MSGTIKCLVQFDYEDDPLNLLLEHNLKEDIISSRIIIISVYSVVIWGLWGLCWPNVLKCDRTLQFYSLQNRLQYM